MTLIRIYNRDRGREIMSEVVEVVPRVGEHVFIMHRNKIIVDAKVVGVHHSFIYLEQTATQCGSVQVSLMLDVD